MKLSPYIPTQANEIKELFTKVFADSEGESEGLLIGKLAQELMLETPKEDLYGFVAIEDEKIVGAIFFSRLRFESDLRAFILSPVAVHTEYQGKGIGQKLLTYGIQKLTNDGVELVMSYGDPNYYSKVGFEPVKEEVIKAPLPLTYPEGWIGQSLVSDRITPIAEQPSCVAALNNPEYW